MQRYTKALDWKYESSLLKINSTIYLVLLLALQFHHIFSREKNSLISFTFRDESRLLSGNVCAKLEPLTSKMNYCFFAERKKLDERKDISKLRAFSLNAKSKKDTSLLEEAINTEDNHNDPKNETEEISFSDYLIEKSKEVEQQLLNAQQTLNQNFLDSEENKSIDDEKSSANLDYSESISSMEKMILGGFENDSDSDVMIDEVSVSL